MAIDYIVDYDCVPKQTLTTPGILERLKGRARAKTVIQMFRDNGDERSPSEMGFEFTRSTPEGVNEKKVIVVQELLDFAAELEPLEKHCVGCPANVGGQSYGCVGYISYPVSARAEDWLIGQLPSPEEALPWLLLRKTVDEMGYTGTSVDSLRANGTFFEESRVLGRSLGEFAVTSNQVFEMIFMLGDIQPAHAGVLLMFFNGIDRNLEADKLTSILNRTATPDLLRESFPFIMKPSEVDDPTVRQLKQFFKALHYAWSLNKVTILDV